MDRITLPNTQTPLRVSTDPKIAVHHFFPTLQGEGPLAGCPSVFIRTYGCSLQCSACDTDYTSKRTDMHIGEVVNAVQEIRKKGLVVLTGGEPFRQPMGPLTVLLLNSGYTVQFETNGLHWQDDLPWGRKDLVVVCSPKTPKINERLEKYVDAFKYVIQDGFVDPNDGLPTQTLGNTTEVYRPSDAWVNNHKLTDIYVQSLDEQCEEKNKRNMKAAMDSCMQYGYRLGIQNHKQLGLE